MNDINQKFFELIQVSLGTRTCLSRMPSAGEWGELYCMAKKQSLVGVCFAGVQRLQAQMQEPPEMLYLTWMGMAAKIQERNKVVNRQCVELQERLAADGFRSYIMKGQGVAALYRLHENEDENSSNLSLLRQSGDIDVYLEGGLDKVLAYAKTFGKVEHVNELEMSVPVFTDTEVEFHYRPFIMRNPFKNRKLQRFFDEFAERNFANKICLCENEDSWIVAPTTEFNMVHQMVHIYHHLFTEGIGMRQLMDYYFVLCDFKTKTLKTPEGSASVCASENLSKLNFSATQTSADSRAVEFNPSGKKQEKHFSVVDVVSSLGLERFASALMWVIKNVFGLSMIGIPWTPNQCDGEFLLNEIMQSGNFGKQDERQRGLYDSKWNSFWLVNGKALRLARFDHWACFWSPVWRVYHFLWRKFEGFK